jgi:hypothetical protein
MIKETDMKSRAHTNVTADLTRTIVHARANAMTPSPGPAINMTLPLCKNRPKPMQEVKATIISLVNKYMKARSRK